jgi:ADP-heptose:LPS heptosyltransferase
MSPGFASPSGTAAGATRDMPPLPSALVPGVERIAVLRANGIGDFVFTLPALAALRRAYPAAEIVLLGRHWHRGFLTGRPGPWDRVVVRPGCRGVNDSAPDDPAAIEAFFAAMRAERFDLAVQLHGGGRHSNPFVRRLGAQLTVGLRTPDAEPVDRWSPYVYLQNEIARGLETVVLVGAIADDWQPRLAVTPRDLAESQAAVPDDDHRPFAVINPGAGDPRRRWPPDGFAAVADRLADAGLMVVVTGVGGERPAAAAVVAGMRRPAADLAGRLSLEALAGLLSRAAVVVSNDSGPLHLAGAVGAATVGIYWGPNLVNAGPPGRARHRPVVSWTVTCPACGADRMRSACGHGDSLVAGVTADEVAEAATELLADLSPPSARGGVSPTAGRTL